MIRTIAVCLISLLALSVASSAGPSISNLSAPTGAGLYQKYEISFEVATVAENPYWPYDPDPAANTAEHPNAVPAGVGVSVDGLFLPPGETDWSRAVVQPGFHYQEYVSNGRTMANFRPWLHPVGDPQWRVRFAPTAVGGWIYRIRVTDAGGTTLSPQQAFICTDSESSGFVRVSSEDSRYFELTDGTYVPFVGLEVDSGSTEAMNSQYPLLQNMGVNLIRCWWQSSNPQLALFGAGGQGGDGNWAGLDYTTDHLAPGRLVNARVAPGSHLSSYVAGKPSTQYRLKARLKTVGALRNEFVYLSAWPFGDGRLTLQGDTDWTDLILDFTTNGDSYELGNLKIVSGLSAGYVYVSEMSVRENLGNGRFGPEMFMRPDLQAHTSYSQQISWIIDRQLELAEQNGIYVNAVIEEKGDSFYARIGPDGEWSDFNVDNVYANTEHASRSYQVYFWRYLIARYGYSTALHSVELVNEGDPYNGNHYNALGALGAYFAAHDPNKHLVTTSNWHSLPPVMWRIPEADYATLHMYLGWAVACGGNRILSGWDGTWAGPTQGGDSLGDNLAWDETVKHSGQRSLKVTVPPNPGDTPLTEQTLPLQFDIGARIGHQIKLSYWVKAENLIRYPWPKDTGHYQMYMRMNGWAWHATPPSGTYDWQYVEETVRVQNDYLKGLVHFEFQLGSTNSSDPGYIWLDDMVIEDLTTGEILNYNGGFENVTSQSYDVVAGHCGYSRLARSYGFDKPIVRGETGICHPLRFATPYKGFHYTGEDQLLVDDIDGIWWKKWVWANMDPGGLIEIYWWHQLPLARGYTYGKAFQNFMADIPLSNGHYADIAATGSNPALRVIGQKDLTDNRAHLWIDNKPYTWKSVVDGVSVPPVQNATVTVPGLADGNYTVEWWDTRTGEITRVEEIACSNQTLVLSVASLQSDVACKIHPAGVSEVDLTMSAPVSVVRPSTVALDGNPGDVVTLTVGYHNPGSTAVTMNIAATVPSEVEYVAGSAEASGGVYDPAARSVSWTIKDVAAGASGNRTYQVRVGTD